MHPWVIGDLVDVLDRFVSRQSGIHGQKWRKAEVVDVTATTVCVSFLGWDKQFDTVIDVTKEPSRVTPFGIRTDAMEQAAEAGRTRERIFRCAFGALQATRCSCRSARQRTSLAWRWPLQGLLRNVVCASLQS